MPHTAAGSVKTAVGEEISVQQLLERIVKLCSFMEDAFSAEKRRGRPQDFLQLLKEEQRALELLERRMEEALAQGTDPAAFERKLDEIQQAHSRCQEVLRQRVSATRGILQELQARQSGQQTYSENRA